MYLDWCYEATTWFEVTTFAENNVGQIAGLNLACGFSVKRVFEFKNVQGYVQLSKMLVEFKTQFDSKTKIEVLDQLPI